MLSRKEINQRYYKSNKEDLKQKRKEREKEKKKEKMRKELESIDFKEKNIYLEKMGGLEMEEYCAKRRKRFDLQFDIDNLDQREKGDYKEYFKKKNESYHNYCAEMDAKFRIEKYRLFRNSYFKKFEKEPNLTSMVVNDNIIPEEVNPESEKYNENMNCYLEAQEGDNEVEIRQVADSSDEE